jgi:hypothetical protein
MTLTGTHGVAPTRANRRIAHRPGARSTRRDVNDMTLIEAAGVDMPGLPEIIAIWRQARHAIAWRHPSFATHRGAALWPAGHIQGDFRCSIHPAAG